MTQSRPITTNAPTYLDFEALTLRMKSIKLIASDVDGVLTDDTIYFGPNDLELKKFNVSDGFYISLAMRAGLEFAVISGRPSEATTSRMRDLGVRHVLQAPINKAQLIKPLIDELKLDLSQVAFIGNEILDLPIFRIVGLPIGVRDSSPAALREVSYITAADGGAGAVREVIEAWFIAHGHDPEELMKLPRPARL